MALAATGFVGLLGLRAARAPTSTDRVLKWPANGPDGVAMTEDAVVIRSGGTVRAFSRRCPHLGCLVSADADGDAITCPCHGSRFDLDGNRISGPAQRGLAEIDVEVTSS